MDTSEFNKLQHGTNFSIINCMNSREVWGSFFHTNAVGRVYYLTKDAMDAE